MAVLVVPLWADALAEVTPGNADRALAIRRSPAVHVIPATEKGGSAQSRQALDLLAPARARVRTLVPLVG